MRQHGGEWDPGARRWLIERRRIGPVLRALWRDTDPLFGRAGIDLDGRTGSGLGRGRRGGGMMGVANRYQRNRRGPTLAGTTYQCLAGCRPRCSPAAPRQRLTGSRSFRQASSAHAGRAGALVQRGGGMTETGGCHQTYSRCCRSVSSACQTAAAKGVISNDELARIRSGLGGWQGGAAHCDAPLYIRNMVRSPKPLTLPHQVGPCQIAWLGSLVAIRCPKDLDRIVGRTAATWEPGSGRWLVSPSRAAKLVPKLRRATDPLFRKAGMSLDQ
jgi:hypothetical protein